MTPVSEKVYRTIYPDYELAKEMLADKFGRELNFTISVVNDSNYIYVFAKRDGQLVGCAVTSIQPGSSTSPNLEINPTYRWEIKEVGEFYHKE